MGDERLSSDNRTSDPLKITLKLPVINTEPQIDNLFNLFSK